MLANREQNMSSLGF